jgi:hypothetical protein
VLSILNILSSNEPATNSTAPHLVPRFANTFDISALAEITKRAPKRRGGSGGSSGGGSDDDDDSSSGSSCNTRACSSSQKQCGDSCIASTETCCSTSSDLVARYCGSSERCVPMIPGDSTPSGLYRCCPTSGSNSSTCASSISGGRSADLAMPQYECTSGAGRTGMAGTAGLCMAVVAGGAMLGL